MCSICHFDPVLLAYLFLKKGQEGLMTHPMYFVEKSNMMVIVETGCGTENETLWMLITTNSYTYSPK